MTVVAIGGAGIWGPSSALTARLVAAPDRPTAFGFGFMLLDMGLGLGGLISSADRRLRRPRHLQAALRPDVAGVRGAVHRRPVDG